MTQEEKAKRYDEAIIRGSRLWESDMITRENYEYIFPEVKESENDMIRKDCLKYLDWEYHRCSHDEDKIKIEKCITWLKKHEEDTYDYKSVDLDKFDERIQEFSDMLEDKPKPYWDGWYEAMEWIRTHGNPFEKQDERKSTNKVKHKFNDGDWVVSPNGVYWHIDKIINNRYEVTSNTGESSNWNLDTNIYHKFTIQDAKDGDIIYSRHNIESFEWIGIFKSLDKENKRVFFYGFWHDMAKSFSVCRNEAFVLYDDFSPATKEQCELLFQKMKEAGYEWDSCSKKIINNR